MKSDFLDEGDVTYVTDGDGKRRSRDTAATVVSEMGRLLVGEWPRWFDFRRHEDPA